MVWGASMIIIGGRPKYNIVRQFTTVTKRWETKSKWPQLGGRGRWRHGCSLLGSRVIVAGGVDTGGNNLDTTVIMDLTSHVQAVWVDGGRLNAPRYALALVTIKTAGQETLYALGGDGGGGGGDRFCFTSCEESYGGGNQNHVERWEEKSSSWQSEEERIQGKKYMGAVAVSLENVCTD